MPGLKKSKNYYYIIERKTVIEDGQKKQKPIILKKLGPISKFEAEHELFQFKKSYNRKHANKSHDLTLGRFIPIFLENYKHTGIRPRTFELAKDNCKVLKNHLGHMLLKDIDYDEVVQLTLKLSESHNNRGVNIKLNTLSLLFNTAIRKHFIRSKPIIDRLPEHYTFKIERLTQEQIKEVLQLASERITGHKIVYCLKLMLYTGMRPAEAASLKWEDINFQNRTLSILSDNPKKKGRVIPIHDAIYDMLYTKKDNPNENVSPYKTSGIQTLLKRIRKLVKFNVNVSMLRRTFVSIMIESDVELAKLVKITGHSYKTCLKHYAELRADYLRNDIHKFEI